ncbi:uncharacterized protein BDV17DRAFT_161007 [Aspergillus undulatus]|uniref:uncharacterized protein n=1 Tax=Aspergillus undulatus TaxID=1810928 RepID=UPI003CCCE8C7
MIALATAVAIAVTCSVIFMVSAVVITIIWIKIRQERRSLALIKTSQRPYANGLSTFPAETLTELSREEGSAVRQYGRLPYGRPTEWGLLASRESVDQSADDKSPKQLLKKMRSFSLKHSISSKSKRQSKNVTKPVSLRTLTETSEGPPSQDVSASKEELVTSAVDGVMELPAETTPRQTPEREDVQPTTDTTIRPVSGVWPLLQHKDRSSSLFPVFDDHYEAYNPDGSRARGGRIASQAPRTAPDQPVPPPPCAYPPNRFRLSKNDSLRYSSVSLETADSSILNDSRRTSTNVDGSQVSPALPPCPTFAPFSANDLGREYERRSFAVNAAPFIFPPNSPARKGQRVDTERSPPRRSLTACSPTRWSERISPPPRRSESLSARETHDNSYKPYLDLDHIPPLNITPRNSGLLPHFSQMQRHSMHDSPRRDNDPFHNGIGTPQPQAYTTYTPGKRASSFMTQGAASQLSAGHPKPPLASAMKNGGHRKGHRRQNCVRISIHPPITFAGPAFSPMVEEAEEPEEVVELDIRRSEISDVSASNISRDSSVSAMSTTHGSSIQNTQTERPFSRIIEVPNDTQIDPSGSPVKKKRQTQPDTGSATEKEKALSGLLTSLPINTDKETLSRTPSPERNPPVWKIPDYQGSPTTIENSLVPGSPRRSAVMGPRNPPKPARSSYQSLIPSEDTKPASSSPPSSKRPPPPRNPSVKQKQSSAKPAAATSIRPVKSEAKEQTPPRSKSQSDRNRASHYTISTSSSNAAGPGSPSPPQKIPGAQVSAIVPIYEDCDKSTSKSTITTTAQATLRRSTVSLVYDPPTLSPGKNLNDASVSPRSLGNETAADRMTRMSSYRNQQGCATPATPGSLYDGYGFLKE